MFGRMRKEFSELEVKASSWSKYEKDAYLRSNRDVQKLRA